MVAKVELIKLVCTALSGSSRGCLNWVPKGTIYKANMSKENIIGQESNSF